VEIRKLRELLITHIAKESALHTEEEERD